VPIGSKVCNADLLAMHRQVEEMLADRGLYHVSASADGAAVEQSVVRTIEQEAVEAKNVHSWTFNHPETGLPSLLLQTPKLTNGRPRILINDGLHNRKNLRNAILTGTRALTLGFRLVHFFLLLLIVQAADSPLMKSDVINVDKQDDRAAARLFASSTLEFISRTLLDPESHGLAIYIFTMGSIIDAQQSRTLNHGERMRMLWRGRFFLEGWRQYVLGHPHYSLDTHFISRELYSLLIRFINSSMLLILVYRDYFPRIPLLLWLHSTEVCEHVFGCARKIQKDFTFVEFLFMVPKLDAILSSDLRSTNLEDVGHSSRGGYHHTWYNTDDLDRNSLLDYPSNNAINNIIKVAYTEASQLLSILGMPKASAGVDEAAFLCTLEHMLEVPSEDVYDISGATEINTEASAVLEAILSNETEDALMSLRTEHGLHPEAMNYGVTNMAAIIADMEAM
jgi:hypothetical protein